MANPFQVRQDMGGVHAELEQIALERGTGLLGIRKVCRAMPSGVHPDFVATTLERARRDRGLSQTGLARVLGTSQSTVSKLLSAGQNPRPALRAAIRRFVDDALGDAGSEPPDLLVHVQEASNHSEPFRKLLFAAVNLMNENE